MNLTLAADLVPDWQTLWLITAGLMLLLLLVLVWLGYKIRRLSGPQDLDLENRLDLFKEEVSRQIGIAGREQREINNLFMEQLKTSEHHSQQTLTGIGSSLNAQMKQIYANLDEMKRVAGDVSSLKQALGSIRGRGVVGELQLEQLLADVLSPTQYKMQAALFAGSQEAVDAAIRLSDGQNGDVWLPIDAKFPLDYLERLLAARAADDEAAAQVFAKELTGRIRQEAKKISQRYVKPPVTTDFAILYLPGETLFGEAMRDGSLAGDLYRQSNILLAGPTSLAAILAGLQAIFRLQNMEIKSLEIAHLLAQIQREFITYEQSLEKTYGRLTRSVRELENCRQHAGQISSRLQVLHQDSGIKEDLFETGDRQID